MIHTPNNAAASDFTALLTFAERFRLADAPGQVVHQAKRTLLDGLAAMTLGARETDVADISGYLEACGSAQQQATVVGRSAKAAFRDAIFANAAFSQVHDANDGFVPDKLGRRAQHPGRVIVPAALGLAERYQLTGAKLLELVIIGYELAGRVLGLPRPDPQVGFAPAVMCGRLVGFDCDQYRNAIALALFFSPTFSRLNDKGKGLDDFALAHGQIARSGIEAALLSRAGFQCPTFARGQDHGLTIDQDHLGERFCVDELYFKPYPACRSVHGPAEAAMQLHQEHDFTADQIQTAQIELANQAIYTERPIDLDNADRILCASHPRYVAACALIDRQIDLERFRNHRLKDPQLFSLVDRMTTVENAQFTQMHGRDGRPTRLTLTLRDGRALSCQVNHALGSPNNPMTDDQLADKFARYCGPAVHPKQSRRIVERIFDLDAIDDLEQLTSSLRYNARP